jgi:hypothetical protein
MLKVRRDIVSRGMYFFDILEGFLSNNNPNMCKKLFLLKDVTLIEGLP